MYDLEEVGIYNAPRVGWMLRVFGHPRVHLLNSYKLWVEEGFPMESELPESPTPSRYPVSDLHWEKVVQFETMQKLCSAESTYPLSDVCILDARSFGRWSGEEKEPFPGKFRSSFQFHVVSG